METTIANWQYVDRLTGLYEEMGVSINREPYGPLTGTLVPPCISILSPSLRRCLRRTGREKHHGPATASAAT